MIGERFGGSLTTLETSKLLEVKSSMKAWKGRKRIAKLINSMYFTEPSYKKTMDYLLAAKPGDIVRSCKGLNHRIVEIAYVYRTANDWRPEEWPGVRTKTRMIWEVAITDDDGGYHLFDGSYSACVYEPSRPEAIEAYFKGWDTDRGHKVLAKWDFIQISVFINFLRRGLHIVDDEGLLLPEVKAVVNEARAQLAAYKKELKEFERLQQLRLELEERQAHEDLQAHKDMLERRALIEEEERRANKYIRD